MQLTKFNELWNAVQSYKIDLIDDKSELINDFINNGIDTTQEDIFEVNGILISIFKDGSIRRNALYISQRTSNNFDKWGYPKKHTHYCKTIKDYKIKGNRYEKYKRQDIDNKIFKILITGAKDIFHNVELDLCYNCKNISRNDFNTLDYIYFQEELEYIPQVYASNWKEISNKIKHMKNYICENCNINLQNAKKYLHTHHIDTDKTNNKITNLKVLCIECHSNEIDHSHIKNNPIYQEYLTNKGNI